MTPGARHRAPHVFAANRPNLKSYSADLYTELRARLAREHRPALIREFKTRIRN